MNVPEITLFQIAKDKFVEQPAKEFVEALKQTVDDKFQEKKDIFLTKEDKTDMIKWMFIFWATQLLAMFSFIKFFK